MKFTTTRENMLYGINAVQKAISSKNAIPVLSGIYIKAEQDHLTFSATDLEIAIECKVPAQIIKEGHMVLPARYLSELTRRLPDDHLIFEYIQDSVSMKINYENAETYIKGWRGEEFPTINFIEDDIAFEIEPSVLKNTVKQTVFCANTDDVRPVFTGALLELEDNKLNMIATDSYRLAYKQVIVQNPNHISFKKVVPVKALQELVRIAKDDEEDLIIIRSNQNQIAFENSEIKFIARLIDSNYPDYRMVIPKEFSTLLKVKKRTLQNTIDRANLFTTEKDGTNVLKFNITDSVLNIISKSDYGMVDENIDLYQEGDDLTIAFNSRYLMDAFKNMEFEDMQIQLGGPLSPAVFTEINDDKFLYLLLPMRS